MPVHARAVDPFGVSYASFVSSDGVGDQFRMWRRRRSISQLELANTAGVSQRHLSFIETGRSKPSPEMVLTLARHLDVPLREQNRLLIAAGHAPRRDVERVENDATMDQVINSVQHVLDAHDPYPGVLLDRRHDIVGSNQAARLFLSTLPEELSAEPINLFKASLHPDGFAKDSPNVAAWAPRLLQQLRALVAADDRDDLRSLLVEVEQYPAAAAHAQDALVPDPVVTTTFRLHDCELSLYSTMNSFGTPRDISVDGLSVELFFPADDTTEAFLRQLQS